MKTEIKIEPMPAGDKSVSYDFVKANPGVYKPVGHFSDSTRLISAVDYILFVQGCAVEKASDVNWKAVKFLPTNESITITFK